MYTSTIFTAGVNPRGLGAGNSYPWGAYSESTLDLQKIANETLEANGYCPISEDGKLGAKTCGAVREMLHAYDIPTCQKFTPPRKPPCGGVITSGAAPITAHEPYVPPGAGPDTSKMIMIGTMVLAVGVLGYAVAKKKGMIK